VRTIPADLQAKLDSGVTTLARCWILTRTDGAVQGFTEHDEDIVVGSVTCRAGSGLSGSEATAKLGLAVDGSEFTGALADDSLNEDDLTATMRQRSNSGWSTGANRTCACSSPRERSARSNARASSSPPSCAA